MRRLLPVVLAVSMFSPLARAAELKLGYVDLQRALVEIGEGRLAREKLKGDLDKRKAEFEAEQNKIRDDKAILDKQGAMMSEEVRNQKFTELQKRFYELTQKAEKLQVEMAQAEQKELRKIFDKIDPIIAAIAQREGLTMVFEKSDSGLVYAPPSLDLTNELVRTYNDKYRVAGGGKKEGAAPKDAPAAKDAPGAGTK